MNDVYICVDDNSLVVSYGPAEDPKTVTMELGTDAERELVERLLGDVNLWANFLSSLSAALNPENQEKINNTE